MYRMVEFFIILFVVMIAVDVVNRQRSKGDFIETVFLFLASSATALGVLVTLASATLLSGYVSSLTHNLAAASVIGGISIYLVREALDRNEERRSRQLRLPERRLEGGD